MRPLRQFGTLLKDLFNKKTSKHFWVRVKDNAKNIEEKGESIFAIVELLNNRIKINGQNTEH